MNDSKVLEIRNLTKDYGSKGFSTTVLKGIDLSVCRGDFIDHGAQRVRKDHAAQHPIHH